MVLMGNSGFTLGCGLQMKIVKRGGGHAPRPLWGCSMASAGSVSIAMDGKFPCSNST